MGVEDSAKHTYGIYLSDVTQDGTTNDMHGKHYGSKYKAS